MIAAEVSLRMVITVWSDMDGSKTSNDVLDDMSDEIMLEASQQYEKMINTTDDYGITDDKLVSSTRPFLVIKVELVMRKRGLEV